MTDVILYNELEDIKRKQELGQPISLSGTPSNGKFHALDGSSLLRTEYPELDNVYPAQRFGASYIHPALPEFGSWSDVTYGAGIYVALQKDSLYCAISSDGIIWTQQLIPFNTNWSAISYGNGVFVVVASNTTLCATSSDGITWELNSLGTTRIWEQLCFANGIFVLLVYSDSTCRTSSDGITWTQQTMPTWALWNSITYGNGVFVALSIGTVSATSPDGINWTQHSIPISNVTDITFGNGVFIGVGYNNNTSIISSDGINWIQYPTLPFVLQWNTIAYGSNGFLLLSYNTGTCAFSYDGIVWNIFYTPVNRYNSVIYTGNDTFMAVSDNTSTITLIHIVHAVTHIELPITPNKYIQVKS